MGLLIIQKNGMIKYQKWGCFKRNSKNYAKKEKAF
jgi:hypothetical protein